MYAIRSYYVRSVWQALVHVADGREVIVTADPAVVSSAERVVFPGQGAMPDCMRELDARGLRPVVLDAAKSKPFLGICIGLQMLFEHSEEGDVPGLGVFSGSVRRFPSDKMFSRSGERLKVPHMGVITSYSIHYTKLYEHDELAQSVLLCPDGAFIEKVFASIERLLPTMPRQEIIQASYNFV